jgi:hypothetical protein
MAPDPDDPITLRPASDTDEQMSRRCLTVLLAGSLLCLSAAAIWAQPSPEPGPVDAVEALLADDRTPFPTRVAAVRRVESALASEADAGRAGALALLHLRALRWLLASVPMDGSRREPYRSWLDAHETIVVYNEPGGEWILSSSWLWDVHDAHRETAAAEPIAWLAVENRLPGECEGYAPCYAYTLNLLPGEYLRRHPDGAHAADAATIIRRSCEETLRLQSDPAFQINPAEDCRELASSLDALRDALLASPGEAQGAALGAIAALRAFCR